MTRQLVARRRASNYHHPDLLSGRLPTDYGLHQGRSSVLLQVETGQTG
jgi:hypothetical protein